LIVASSTLAAEGNSSPQTPQLILPNGGDCSYPGLVWRDGQLWASYYSSHQGRTSIYLARIDVK
jgi:hypothetical protein